MQARQSSAACQDNCSPTLVLELPNIIERKADSLSESVPCFGIEIANILFLLAEHRDARIISQLVSSLTDTCFEMNNINRYNKSLADYDDATSRITRELKKDNDLHRALVIDGNRKKTVSGTR